MKQQAYAEAVEETSKVITLDKVNYLGVYRCVLS